MPQNLIIQNGMKKIIVIIALCLFFGFSFAQEINGILFESRYPVTIRLDGQRVNVPSQSSFIANLRPGIYNVQADANGRIIFADQIRYNGRGTMIIALDNGINRPPFIDSGCQPDYIPSMSPGQFKALMNSVNSEAFDDNKMRIIKMAALNNDFTSAQIAAMVSSLTFNQVKMAKELFKNCTDPENYLTTVGNSFTYSTDKMALEKYIDQIMSEME